VIGSAPLVAAVLAAGFGPFATPGHPVTRDAAFAAPPPREGGDRSLELPWRAYRATIGAFQGPRCPHSPSCSLYARAAVRRHGLVAGLVLTVPRLLRGERGSGFALLPRDEEGRLVDLLDDATFWLGGGGLRPPTGGGEAGASVGGGGLRPPTGGGEAGASVGGGGLRPPTGGGGP
jgi:putative component of membrane protein insertase Oxa1/YidC/SpoIIIJ protein YidD